MRKHGGKARGKSTELGRRGVMMCSICQNLYSDGGDYLSLLYRKSLIYAIKTYYILVFFVVRGFYAYQLKQGHQKPSKPVDKCTIVY